MQELALNWYVVLGGAYAAVTEPLSSLARQVNLPLLSALLLGLLGAVSPCQFTTGASALAFMAGSSTSAGALVRGAAAYTAGKAVVYSAMGLAVILAGQALAQSMVPVVQATRQALGPLMILLALFFFGLLRLPWSLGGGLAQRMAGGVGAGPRGAFLLGVAFSFAFCPTLFLLFFGLTIPLALQVAEGPLLPPAFALGTTLPLLALAALVAMRPPRPRGEAGPERSRTGQGETMPGTGSLAYVRQVRRLDRWLRPAAALVLLVAGLNDTFVYWFL